jgi:RNA polymerase sigma-70 factor (ECF subfamily)
MAEPVLSTFQSEKALLAALRAGDEQAFSALVDAYGAAMRRFALTFVRTQAVADEVVQEAWLGMLRGLDSFEGRSSLKTWLFRIVSNTAKTRAVREARTVPFSAFDAETGIDEAAVPADRFHGPDHVYAGGWVAFPQPWSELPEARLETAETRTVISRAISDLPTAQRIVITLRDVEGLAAEEVCNVLEVSETNQRVLLHRARSKVRAALESYLTEETL